MATHERQIGVAQFGDIVLTHAHVSATDDATWNSTTSSSSSLTRLVAIKRVSLSRFEELVCEGVTLEDPFQEVRVAAKIAALGGHPHVVQHLSSYIQDDHLYLTMQFCDDGDLLHALERETQEEEETDSGSMDMMGMMGEQNALAIVSQIAQALDFAHRRVGVAHRDVSLENVFVHDGQCKLGDFDLSVVASARPSDSVGKMAYMAPEVVAASTSTTASTTSTASSYNPCAADVWSLGIVLFMLLTGSPLVEVASADHAPFCTFCRLGGVREVLNLWDMLESVERPETLDLCDAMLQVDPAKRISVREILSHPAITSLTAE